MLKSDKNLELIAKPIWNKACGIYPKLKSFDMPVIRFDGRLTKAIAYTYYWNNLIRVSKRFYVDNKELIDSEIIGHEIAHQIVYNLYGEVKDDHGGEWIETMIALELPPDSHYEVNYENWHFI